MYISFQKALKPPLTQQVDIILITFESLVCHTDCFDMLENSLIRAELIDEWEAFPYGKWDVHVSQFF